MKTKKNPDPNKYNDISARVTYNEGFCPCDLRRIDDTHFMCKEFREQTTSGFCHCGRYYKVPTYRIITLCGSTKFKDDFIRVQKELTLQGNVVISVGLFGHAGDDEANDSK